MDSGEVTVDFSLNKEHKDLLNYEEQRYKLDMYLRQMNKLIQPVEQNGLCIFQSFKTCYESQGIACNVDGLKNALKQEIIENIEFYQQFSTETVDVIREMNLFLENPEKYYASDTVDLFLDAIAKALSIKVKVFQINSQGEIVELNVGTLANFSYEFFFARYSILHVDPVLELIKDTASENLREELTEIDDVISCNSKNKIENVEISENISPTMLNMNNVNENMDLSSVTTEQLLNFILITPEKYEVKYPLKGVRGNLMYTIKNASINMINSDDNGSYTLFGSTKKLYHVEKNENTIIKVTTVHSDDDSKRYFYKQRDGRGYVNKYVPARDVYTVQRDYRRNKSISGLRHLTVKVKSEESKKFNDYTCVIYSISGEDTTKKSDQVNKSEDEVKLVPHGNSKNSDRPYVRTSQDVLGEEDLLLGSNKTVSEIYDQLVSESGGPLNSQSQSLEPRDLQQIYRRKSLLTKMDKNEKSTLIYTSDSSDDLMNILHAQKSNTLIRSVVVTRDAYYIVLITDRQINDILKFCCIPHNSSVLGVDTTYNLCDLWMTDTCYRNKRLINPKTKGHPVFLGPMMFHFTKDEGTFMRFALELFTSNSGMSNLKYIGVDLESAIFKGFKTVFLNLKRLSCVRHVSQRDVAKLDKLLMHTKANKVDNARAKAEILKDIYGEHNGASYDFGLAEAFDNEDFKIKLSSLESKWNGLCPEFFSWFRRQREELFCSSIIQSAREGTDMVGLFYQNDVESMHYVEKLNQSFQKLSVLEVINCLQKFLTRQEEEEIRAIYGAGTYVLADPYKEFRVDSARWHSWSRERRVNHVSSLQMFEPTLNSSFSKPKNCGRKPGQQVRDRKRITPDVISDRLQTTTSEKVSRSDDIVTLEPSQNLPRAENTVSMQNEPTSEKKVEIRFLDPRKDPPQIFEIHFRKNLPRMIEKCRGGCGVRVTPNDSGMLIRTYGTTRWTNKSTGHEESRYGPMYLHFQDECLKRYNSNTYYSANKCFDYSKITVDKKVQSELNKDESSLLMSLGVRFL